MIFHTHNCCRQIHHLQPLVHHLLDADLIVFHRIRMNLRVLIINAVNGLCQQDRIRLNLNGPQRCPRIC